MTINRPRRCAYCGAPWRRLEGSAIEVWPHVELYACAAHRDALSELSEAQEARLWRAGERRNGERAEQLAAEGLAPEPPVPFGPVDWELHRQLVARVAELERNDRGARAPEGMNR